MAYIMYIYVHKTYIVCHICMYTSIQTYIGVWLRSYTNLNTPDLEVRIKLILGLYYLDHY